MAMENMGGRVEDGDPSTSRPDVIIDETGMPSTAVLMDFMKKINPFDQKFREANEAMKAGDFTQVLNTLSTTSPAGPSNAYDSNESGTTQSSSMNRTSTPKSSINDLRLKLPDPDIISAALDDMRVFINPDSSAGCGLDTPLITDLITQMKEDGSTPKAVPLTADVMNKVLEMRETMDLQRQKKASLAIEPVEREQVNLDSDQPTNALADTAYQEQPVGLPGGRPDSRCVEQQQQDIGPCDSLLSTDLDSNRLSSSPPALPHQECVITSASVAGSSMTGQLFSIAQHQFHGPVAMASTFQHQPAQDDVVLALKIGDQSVHIPLKLSYTRANEQNVVASPQLASTPAPTSGRRKFQSGSGSQIDSPFVSNADRNVVSSGTCVIASSSQAVFDGQPIVFPTSVLNQALPVESAGYSCASTPSADVSEEEMRKREVLERNKQAACRYRKRKKEEMSTIQGKLKKSENEKLELSTQVQVLKMEVERLRNILDLHRDCSVAREQKKKQRNVDFVFEQHAPLFHSIITRNTAAADEEESRSSTPAESQPIPISISDFRLVKETDGGVPSKIRITSTKQRSSPSTTVSASVILPSQSAVFSTATSATGQLVHYVTLPSPVQNPDAENASGQKFILQPVIVPTAQTMMISGGSSPMIFPAFMRMDSSSNSAFTSSGR